MCSYYYKLETLLFLRFIFIELSLLERKGEMNRKKSQSYREKNGNINQKERGLPANCPQKIKMVILNQNL